VSPKEGKRDLKQLDDETSLKKNFAERRRRKGNKGRGWRPHLPSPLLPSRGEEKRGSPLFVLFFEVAL